MAEQLFYGSIDSVNPVKGPTNSFNRIYFNSTAGSNVITDVIPRSGYAGYDLIFEGMYLNATSTFEDAIIESFDPVAQTITLNATASSTNTGQTKQGRVSPGLGQYFIPSASLYDPQSLQTVRTITGSKDDDYDGSSSIYAVLGPMANSLNTAIPGRFHKYNIVNIPYKSGNSEFSFLMQWGEKGEEPSDEQLFIGSNQTFAIVQLSTTESLAPTFSTKIGTLGSVPGGSDQAGYQIEVTDFFDDIVSTDIYYTGSEVSSNNRDINFSGSGVEVTPSGSDGVLVDIKNDTLTSFYTGSEVLTSPTNKINFTGSGVEVESSGSDGILVTIDGGGSGGTYTNSDPTPINFPSDDDPNIPSGTTFTNKTFPEMMDLMLYPELDPTLTNPSNTFSISPSGLREIGETITTITLSATFSKGSINPQYTSATPFRSGDPNTYVYTGTGTSNNASTSLTDTELVTSYTVLQGSNSWTGAVSYNAGPQPKTSKDNDYDSPLSAGTTSAITRTITGVYPAFATTSAIGTLTKQSLQSMSTYIQVSMVAETGNGDKQTIDIPDAWNGGSGVSGLQQFNTLSGTWDSISLSSFTTSATTQTIQGNSVNYTKYTYNGSTIGARQLRFTV